MEEKEMLCTDCTTPVTETNFSFRCANCGVILCKTCDTKARKAVNIKTVGVWGCDKCKGGRL